MSRRFPFALTSLALLGLLAGCGGGGSSAPDPLDKVVFVRSAGGNAELFLLDLNTMVTLQLTNNSVKDSGPAFSPDGTKIAFVRGGNIAVINADSSGYTELTASANDSEPAWSPDGSKIVFTSFRDGNREIYVMDSDGSNETRLTNDPAFDQTAAFNRAGDKILFSRRVGGQDDLWIMNPDGTGATELFPTPGSYEYFASFSPDGTEIVFTSWNGGPGVIRRAKLDGTGLATVDPGDSESPGWGKNGRIAFVKDVGGTFQVFVTDRNGNNALQVTSGAENCDSPSLP